MLSVVLTVSTHARIWVTTYYSCICQARVHDTRNGWKKTRVLMQTKMHECSSWKNTRARANQNARVQFVETQDTRVLFVQTMMHTAAD